MSTPSTPDESTQRSLIRPPRIVFGERPLDRPPTAQTKGRKSLRTGRELPERHSFHSGQELWEYVQQLHRARRPDEALELELRAATLFPKDLALRVLTIEAALRTGQIELARTHMKGARVLVTRRVHPGIKAELHRLSVELMARGQVPSTKPDARVPRPSPKAPSTPSIASIVAPTTKPNAQPAQEIRLLFRAAETAIAAGDSPDAAVALAAYSLRQTALAVLRLQSFETLLALSQVTGVDHYDYQLRTVMRVLREFFGRVLLADEVGLGKTVEACLCLKEYLLRGLVTRVLILVPPALRDQWHDELQNKFGIESKIVESDFARADPRIWAHSGVLIASLGLARLEPHAKEILGEAFDLVIVDEAHRLKNRRSRSWQLVDRLRSRFLLLLSATPIENDLIEIYNLLSLLKPGMFSTEAEFKRAFVGTDAEGKHKKRAVKDPHKLRSLLREVMIRNTRALAEAKLPARFATTLRAIPGAVEAELYIAIATAIRRELDAGRLTRTAAGEILRAAGSSPAAAAPLLEARLDADLAQRARELSRPAKDGLLVELLSRKRDEKILLFAAHIATLEHVAQVARECGRKVALFHGRLSATEKQNAIAAFAADSDVLVASESGGEGFNMQFARTVLNYDLPWNPMRIEQRIGRVHRIGQARDVFIFNLVTANTLEEEVLRVLDEKINMFELVVGEVEAILGRLGDDEQEFQDLVLELYVGANDPTELRRRFDALGERMTVARGDYEAVKRLEDAAFGRDLEA